MYVNTEAAQYKKAFAGIFLGTRVVGKQDIPISDGVFDEVYQVPFLVTGVSGSRKGDTVDDYELVLEALDGSDSQLCVSLDSLIAYFAMPEDTPLTDKQRDDVNEFIS